MSRTFFLGAPSLDALSVGARKIDSFRLPA